ncbi:MAG: PAC2 family protein [Actinobacteria bacterium]|nr:PAC2 family protein [Actinomycetota bacterium]
MRSPSEAMRIHQEAQFDEPPVLVHAFSGFVDAGNGVRIAIEHMLTRPHDLLISFDSDEFIDYRARRPRMLFSSDHFTSVDVPRISLHRVTDDDGRDFLLLAGPEPDYQWERFLAAVELIIERYRVSALVGLSAIPWPIPHTRPLSVIVHGNEPTLIAGRSAMLGDIEVPGHVGAMLELRGSELEMPSIGITAQVPHYLVQFEYPQGAVALLEGLQDVVGLQVDASVLASASERAVQDVAAQVADNEAFAAVVAALEAQYDSVATSDAPSWTGGDIPSGDQIAAQVEEFLAGLARGDGQDKDATET